MRDYSQILRQKDGQFTGQRQQNQQQNQGQRQRRQEQMVGSDPERVLDSANLSNLTKRVTTPVANTLGLSAETARQVGIPKKQAHQIVNSAYRSGGQSKQF